MANPASKPRIARTHRRILSVVLCAACLAAAGCKELRRQEADDDAGVDEGTDASGSGGTLGGSGGHGSGGAGAAPGSGGSSLGSGGKAAGSGGTSGPDGGADATDGGGSTSGTGGTDAGTDGSSPTSTGGNANTGGATSGSGGRGGTGGTATATGGTTSGTGGTKAGTGGTTMAVMCTGQTHACLGSCVANTSVATCGSSCDPCPVPTGATATCDGTKCDFTCGSMKKCGSKCVPGTGCCTDSDCPAQNGTARQCDTSSNTCKASGCASGFKPCGSSCIDSTTCCSSNDCTGTCQTCSGPGGSCVAVKSADDTDSCAGTCDSSGACKSKRGQTCNTVSGGCVGGTSCADNYCCDTACTGSCQACDVSGKQGTCSPTTGSPHSGHAACTSDGSSCGGTCTGKSDGTCNYPTGNCGSGPKCATTTTEIPQSTCSAGKCPTLAARTCGGNLICSGTACKTTCSAASDCTGGMVCTNNACMTKVVQHGSQTLTFDTALSGRVQSDGIIDTRVSIGDYADDEDSCGFLSFAFMTAIPTTATVTGATLTFTQQSVTGSPYTDLSNKGLVVDHTSYTALSKSVYNTPFANSVAIVPNDATTGAKTAAVPSFVQMDVSKGSSTAQFRLCFVLPTDANADQDFVLIPTGGSNKPTLVVNYDY